MGKKVVDKRREMRLPKKVTIKCGIKKGANGALVFCKDGISPNCIDYLDDEGCPNKITVWTMREATSKIIYTDDPEFKKVEDIVGISWV